MPTMERRVGRYLLLEPVGRGAMGIVYRAEDPLIARTVAVKILHASPAMTPQQIGIARERFRREAECAGRLDHENIIRIFDVGETFETGEMYIVMEYVAGPSLEQRLHDGDLEPASALGIIGQVAAGLDAAHAQGLIHRDIKPSNVLLTENGAAKLVDFGLTHVATSTLTQDMREIGTPAYMSPEQLKGRPLDARADLFSLAVLSYEALSGRKPFQGADAVSLAHAIAYEKAVPILTANPDLPEALGAVMERALAKEPGERFASGKALHEALVASFRGGDGARSPTETSARPSRRLVPWGIAGVAALAFAAFLLRPGGDRSEPPVDAPSTATSGPTAIPAPSSRPRLSAARPAVAPAKLTIRLVHRVRNGTLVLSIDGDTVHDEAFSKSRLALQQTTIWEPIAVSPGRRTLRARVTGGDGKTYLSAPLTVELPKGGGVEVRIRFKGDTLAIDANPA